MKPYVCMCHCTVTNQWPFFFPVYASDGTLRLCQTPAVGPLPAKHCLWRRIWSFEPISFLDSNEKASSPRQKDKLKKQFQPSDESRAAYDRFFVLKKLSSSFYCFSVFSLLFIEASSNLHEALLQCIPTVTPMEDDTSQMKHGWISAHAFPSSPGSSAAEDKVMVLRENGVFVLRRSISGGPRRAFVGFRNLLYY